MYSEASTYVLPLFSFFGSHRFVFPLRFSWLHVVSLVNVYESIWPKFTILSSGMGSPRAVDVWLFQMSTTFWSYVCVYYRWWTDALFL